MRPSDRAAAPRCTASHTVASAVSLLLLLGAGCSAVNVRTEELVPGALAEVRSYTWRVPTTATSRGGVTVLPAEDPVLFHALELAVAAELSRRGLHRVDAATAEVIVAPRASYQIGTEHTDGYFLSAEARQYEDGLLEIEFVDARTEQVLWRGSGRNRLRDIARGSGPVRPDMVPLDEPRNWRVDENVKAMFAKFPRPVTR